MAVTNYIFVDFENVQPEVPAVLKNLDVQLVIFVGSSQAKLNTELVIDIQELGSKAEYVKIEGNGRNALDFHIAFYIGRISAINPNSFFHIVSKDAGFDPLIAHLKLLEIEAHRHDRIVDIPSVGPKTETNLKNCVLYVVKKLSERKTPRPKTRTTLKNLIKTVLGEKLKEGRAEEIVCTLFSQNLVTEKDGKLVYHLPAANTSE